MIKHYKGDLFSSIPENNTLELLVHSCNCKGVWGAGIAKLFKLEFQQSYEEYKHFCNSYGPDILGKSYITSENIGCLFTSNGYGKFKDPKEKILKNTKSSVFDLIGNARTFNANINKLIINSPKINSGLFGVPWEHTEAIINECINDKKYTTLDIEWRVWEL